MPAQTAAHKTGIPIAAVDISPYKTHAILAGKEILKTVRIADRKITEDLNLRSAVTSYASAHGSANGAATASKRRDFLSATDVKWSHGEYDSIIATASNNGRLAIYDIKRPEVELLWLHEHTRQVHTLGFNPFQGALLLSGSHDGTVKYWDLRASSRERSSLTLNSTKQFPGRAEAVRDLKWSPTDGVEFVTCTDGGTIFKWDSRKTDRPELRINGHEKACYAIDWHPDGRHVVSGSADKNVRVWDFKNSDRRQKPSFQFRVPQTVMNIRWRPASWSSTLHSTGDWESTQLAIGYNQDDPRVHIWDLRRPLIPFRELDRYNSPATSLLWCTRELLWTVGNEGMFTQTNVQHSAQPPEQISPCTMDWLAPGEFAVFTEDRERRRATSSGDPSLAFRAAGYDEVSSGEQVTISRSMTDDEGIHEVFLGASYKRTFPSRGSVKSVRSMGNTPPSRDDQHPVLPLNKAVFERGSKSRNRQVGLIGTTTGATVDLPTVRFLAENYARPATEAERKQSPTQVLKRLEEVFQINGDMCDQVAMHRLGQTWRILGAVILPELQAWADQNRRARLNEAVDKGPSQGVKTETMAPEKQAPHVERNKKATGAEGGIGTAPSAKGDLFKAIIRNERQKKQTHEVESTSNMTTPIAGPIPDATLSTPSRSPRPFSSFNGPVEPIPQLPPSVTAAHFTAAAASQALKRGADRVLATPPGHEELLFSEEPPETPDSPTDLPTRHAKSSEPAFRAFKRSKSDWVSSGESRSGDSHRREQNKRAALREYKAQARPILNFDASLDETTQECLPLTMHRHDSVESLQMFSESTGSSQKAKSTVSSGSAGGSYEYKPSVTSEEWDRHREEDFALSSYSQEDAERLDQRALEMIVHNRSIGRSSERSSPPFPDGPFEFEQPFTRHVQQEVRSTSRSPMPLARQRLTDRRTSPSPCPDELQSSDYIYADFAPIDIASYYTNGHSKPWAALPLIAQAVSFDLNLGENHAQFSTHLLTHVCPYFFHRKYCTKQSSRYLSLPSRHTLADRLLQPQLSRRIIESIFQQHHTFLKSLSLHIPAAELRNVCVELDIHAVYRPRITPDEDPDTSLNDGSSLSITCTNPTCSAPLNLSTSSYEVLREPMSCTRCNTPRPPCPICLSSRAPDQQGQQRRKQQSCYTLEGNFTTARSRPGIADLWTFCPACGHSAHMSCMETWLYRSSTEGECPSAGCGHDCAPGAVRMRRVARLAAAAAAAATTATSADVMGRDAGGERKNGGVTESADGGSRKAGRNAASVKDLWRAPQSAAVQRTRGLLKSSVSSVGGTGTGSESERETDDR